MADINTPSDPPESESEQSREAWLAGLKVGDEVAVYFQGKPDDRSTVSRVEAHAIWVTGFSAIHFSKSTGRETCGTCVSIHPYTPESWAVVELEWAMEDAKRQLHSLSTATIERIAAAIRAELDAASGKGEGENTNG